MEAPPFPTAAIEAARDAVKAHLRIAGDGEDSLIEAQARAALALCEAFTGSLLIVRDGAQLVSMPHRWRRLDAVPVVAVTGVTAIAGDGGETPLPTSGYAIDIDATGTGWVRVTAPGVVRVRVAYSAGVATGWATLPPAVAQGVVLLAAHLFGGREGVAEAPPAAVSALWRPWRRMRLRLPEHAA